MNTAADEASMVPSYGIALTISSVATIGLIDCPEELAETLRRVADMIDNGASIDKVVSINIGSERVGDFCISSEVW